MQKLLQIFKTELRSKSNFNLEIHRYASTVYALSSGYGKCGVSVIRVTGERARDVFTKMTIPRSLPLARVATVRKVVHPVTGETLDHGLVLWFPSPNSFTGEDSCELQVHGGSAVISAILSGLSILSEFQPAQQGDFTKRAFYNNKLDLTAVEGLGDLIHAETEAQRRQALRQMEGSLCQLYTGWRQTLLLSRAKLEAYIDFSEDDNIEEGVVEEVRDSLNSLIRDIVSHLSDNRRGEKLRTGLQLAILGRPNVGKSSLINTLVQRPIAIVSPFAGTTRDILETSLDIGGYLVMVSDTAGLRDTEDIVEQEGVRRAAERARYADVALVLIEASELLPHIENKRDFDVDIFLDDYFKGLGLLESDLSSDSNLTGDMSHEIPFQWLKNKSYIILVNKIDLIDNAALKNNFSQIIGDNCLLMSVKTQEGLDLVLSKLRIICSSMCEIGSIENPTITSERHRTHITACLKSLQCITGTKNNSLNNLPSSKYTMQSDDLFKCKVVTYEPVKCSLDENRKHLLSSDGTIIMAAYHLQRAARHLGYVTGHVTTEDVLDQIFYSFCIGK